MSETYNYSKTNVAAREAATRKREKPELLAALLLIWALVSAWAYQAMTGDSVMDVWEGFSDNTRTAAILGWMVIAGFIMMLRGAGRHNGADE